MLPASSGRIEWEDEGSDDRHLSLAESHRGPDQESEGQGHPRRLPQLDDAGCGSRVRDEFDEE